MKPIDPPAQTAPAPVEQDNEAGAALAQRLWQALSQCAALELSAVDRLASLEIALGPAAAGASPALAGTGSTDGAQSHDRDRDRRAADATAALTSAAHLLATSIQQLGITRYESAQASAAPQAGLCEMSFCLRLGDIDANGGSASIDVLHPLLGDIAIDVELEGSCARVIATVATEYGAQILQQGQAILAERLLRQGITLEALDVLVRRKRKGKNRAQAPRKRTRKEER